MYIDCRIYSIQYILLKRVSFNMPKKFIYYQWKFTIFLRTNLVSNFSQRSYCEYFGTGQNQEIASCLETESASPEERSEQKKVEAKIKLDIRDSAKV